MRLLATCCSVSLLVPAFGYAQAPAMSDAQFIAAAQSAAPAAISANAAVARVDAAKKTTTQLRAGTNGFTCSIIPDESNAPFCADKNGWAWMAAAFTGQPKPPNPAPGIAYMAQGGVHFETATGEIVMMANPGTRSVKEPPHWMLLSPIDAAESGLPTKPNAGGVYVMFAGTPYAHLMIYQNPMTMK